MSDGPNPSGLCQCGCGGRTTIAPQSHTAKGWVRGKPIRFISGHEHRNRPMGPPKLEYIEDPDTGCWIWQRAVARNGYGYVGTRGKVVLVHRLMYEQHVGPIPNGMQLDHLCRNRRCVNPAHLEVVTPAENTRRGVNTKLSMDAARRIRTLRASGMKLDEIAPLFGVASRTVSSVCCGETWKEDVA